MTEQSEHKTYERSEFIVSFEHYPVFEKIAPQKRAKRVSIKFEQSENIGQFSYRFLNVLGF